MLVHSCAGAGTKIRGKPGLPPMLGREREETVGETAEQAQASACMVDAEKQNGILSLCKHTVLII